jgi:hypothetical protein
MESNPNYAPINMTTVTERICEMAKNNKVFDDASVIAGISDLWCACRNYLLKAEIAYLEGLDPSEILDWGSGEITDWDGLVRHQLAVAGRKYGFATVTAAVKGTEYVVDVGKM